MFSLNFPKSSMCRGCDYIVVTLPSRKKIAFNVRLFNRSFDKTHFFFFSKQHSFAPRGIIANADKWLRECLAPFVVLVGPFGTHIIKIGRLLKPTDFSSPLLS